MTFCVTQTVEFFWINFCLNYSASFQKKNKKKNPEKKSPSKVLSMLFHTVENLKFTLNYITQLQVSELRFLCLCVMN